MNWYSHLQIFTSKEKCWWRQKKKIAFSSWCQPVNHSWGIVLALGKLAIKHLVGPYPHIGYVCVGPAFPLPVIINTFLCPKAWSVSSVKFVIYAFKCHAIFLCTALFMYALADICKTDMKFIKNLRQKSFEGKNFMQKTCNSPYLLTCNKGVSTSSFRWCDLWKLLVFTLDCIKDGFLKKLFWALPELLPPPPPFMSTTTTAAIQFSFIPIKTNLITLISGTSLCFLCCRW